MKKAVIALVVVTLIVAAWLEPSRILRGIFNREAFFKNRPSSYWRQKLQSDSKAEQISSENMELFSGNFLAIPVLLDCAQDSDKNVRLSAIKLLPTSGAQAGVVGALRTALSDPDDDIKYAAARGLGQLGSEAFDTVPELLSLSQSKDIAVASAANYSLWQIAPDVAAKSAPWQEFVPKDLNFSIAMPGEPDKQESTIETPFGTGNLTQYASTFASIDFRAAVASYPQRVGETFSEEERYDSTAKLKAKALGGNLIKHVAVEQCGISGRETITEVPHKARIHERALIVGDRAYMVSITSIPGLPIHPYQEQFFLDSIKITYKEPQKDVNGPKNDAQSTRQTLQTRFAEPSSN